MTRQETFKAGDIVSFHFPCKEGPGLYARPCLVLEADEQEVLLAYGTTSQTASNRGHDLKLQREFSEAGLHEPTRFVCARRIRVGHTDHRFDRSVDNRATLGHLPFALRARLNEILVEIDGEEDRAVRKARERGGIHPASIRRRAALFGRPKVEVRRSKSVGRKAGRPGSAASPV